MREFKAFLKERYKGDKLPPKRRTTVQQAVYAEQQAIIEAILNCDKVYEAIQVIRSRMNDNVSKETDTS